MTEYELSNGHVVREGNTYQQLQDNKQQGIPKNSLLTVTDIRRDPANQLFYFSVEFPEGKEPLEAWTGESIYIVESAMTNLVEDGVMRRLN